MQIKRLSQLSKSATSKKAKIITGAGAAVIVLCAAAVIPSHLLSSGVIQKSAELVNSLINRAIFAGAVGATVKAEEISGGFFGKKLQYTVIKDDEILLTIPASLSVGLWSAHIDFDMANAIDAQGQTINLNDCYLTEGLGLEYVKDEADGTLELDATLLPYAVRLKAQSTALLDDNDLGARRFTSNLLAKVSYGNSFYFSFSLKNFVSEGVSMARAYVNLTGDDYADLKADATLQMGAQKLRILQSSFDDVKLEAKAGAMRADGTCDVAVTMQSAIDENRTLSFDSTLKNVSVKALMAALDDKECSTVPVTQIINKIEYADSSNLVQNTYDELAVIKRPAETKVLDPLKLTAKGSLSYDYCDLWDSLNGKVEAEATGQLDNLDPHFREFFLDRDGTLRAVFEFEDGKMSVNGLMLN